MLTPEERANRQRDANRKYAAKTKQIPIRLNPEKESEIIAKLESVPNRAGYIKELIMRDIRSFSRQAIEKPHYNVYESRIDGNVDAIIDAFDGVPMILAYSVKTNSIPCVVKKMYQRGLLAEVTSDIEVCIALASGVPYRKMIYNGPAKGELANNVMESGGIVVFDSADDYERVSKTGRCMFRVAVNIENDHGPIDTRFGSSVGDVSKLIDRAISDGNDVVGIHCHVTDGRTIRSWTQKLDAMLDAYDLLKDKLSERIVDMGGNMYSAMPKEMTASFKDAAGYDDYGKLFREYADKFDGATFALEMGTSIISDCMTYTSNVLGVKKTGSNTYVLLDMTNYSLGWSSKRINHKATVNNVSDNQTVVEDAMFVGRLCTEDDVFHRGYSGSIGVGDSVEFENVGSYTVSIKPPFIMPQDAVYYIRSDGTTEVAKRAETADDILSTYNML